MALSPGGSNLNFLVVGEVGGVGVGGGGRSRGVLVYGEAAYCCSIVL